LNLNGPYPCVSFPAVLIKRSIPKDN
jgi:hypothetical protein